MGVGEVIVEPINYRKVLGGDNPWYPLPKDYPELTPEGQKQARLAALRRQDTPLEFVAAWDLFRRLYLMTTEPGVFYRSVGSQGIPWSLQVDDSGFCFVLVFLLSSIRIIATYGLRFKSEPKMIFALGGIFSAAICRPRSWGNLTFCKSGSYSQTDLKNWAIAGLKCIDANCHCI